ncbi:hypothetical protein RDABS01_032080 [Bienertia sinuspersici]
MNETKSVEPLNQDAIQNSENVDRLTKLPMCWSNLWISIPALDFTELPSITNWNTIVKRAQYVRFRSYVNRVLLLSNAPCLNYVHVEAHSIFVARHVFEWMVAIGKRCVQQLIFIAKHFRIDFPLRYLIFKEKLVVLKLEGFRLLLPSSFHFPCLQSLSLNRVSFENGHDDRLTSFISSCPFLEELNVGVYNFCEDSDSEDHEEMNSVELEEMDIDKALYEVRICSTKTLVLYQVILDGSNAYVQLPIFENLMHLEVGFTAWPIVLQIIMNAPRLVSFIIHKACLMFGWPNINPSKKELPLERIEYHGFDVDEDFEVIRYFLSNSALLRSSKFINVVG